MLPKQRILLVTVVLLQILLETNTQQFCASLDIRSSEDLQQARNCKIVVGHVQVSFLDIPTSTSTSDLGLAIEEITDYLLVYRTGLQTLYSILPNLTLIRGQLLFSEQALVVYENRQLINLGLMSLQRIQKGSIRIEANSLLCYVDTVNWVYIMANSTQQLAHSTMKNNKSPNHCPKCSNDMDYDDAVNLKRHCWNFNVYQLSPQDHSAHNCIDSCGPRGCDKHGKCCYHNCLTGCSSSNCKLCANFQHGNKCVDSCNIPPNNFQLNKRTCVHADDCRKQNLIPHAGYCLEKCPSHYQQTIDEKTGLLSCQLLCAGIYVVHSSKDLSGLEDCTIINGSLVIELTKVQTASNAKIIDDLERVLKNVKEITGYLQVTRSPQIVSLSFLSHLDTINGNELIDNKYSFYIVDNHHLEHIWAQNQKVFIINGRVFFHLNPRLCHDKIMALNSTMRNAQKISILDASTNSNGERKICGSYVRELNATVEDFNSTAVRIKVDPMNAEDKEVLLGYLYHYKEAQVKNVTMYDGRHGCGHDNWRMDIYQNQNVRYIISNLKPYTQYAYFVKTLTMTDYHMQIDAYSKIQYFRTLSSKPGPVSKIYYHSLSASEIEVHWWPPRDLNGVVSKYILHYEKVKTPQQNLTNKNYQATTKSKKLSDVCQCSIIRPEFSGPSPEDANYYNKEQITYDEALPNLIYWRTSDDLTVPLYVPSYENATIENETTELSSNNTTHEYLESSDTLLTNETSQLNANPLKNKSLSSTKISDSENDDQSANNINKSEQDDTESGKEKFNKYRDTMELVALKQQDTGPDNFRIIKPPPICSVENPSVQYQLENSCKKLEHFTGKELPGHQHMFILKDLEPEVTYRISVRACVDNLKNGCGDDTLILAETVSKSMETFLKGFVN